MFGWRSVEDPVCRGAFVEKGVCLVGVKVRFGDDNCHQYRAALTLLEPQSRFGDKPLKLQVVCPHIGTAVLKG